MAILPLLTAPDPRLKRSAAPVEGVTDEIRVLMQNMLETMYASAGIGLAAPQVNVLKQVIVFDVASANDKREPYFLANPEIIWQSETTVMGEEGCLSLPEQYAEVARPERIRLRYLDKDNTVQEMDADGLAARCIQHEMDHLLGTLFVDHLSALKRGIILRKLQKAKKLQPAPA